MSTKEIELFFDVGSPYSYLAATRIEALGARVGRPVRWRPFLLGGVFKATGNTMPAAVAAKARYMMADLARWAASYDVPLRFPSRFPLNTLRTQRALVAAGRSSGPEAIGPFALALFHAYWADDRDVSSDEVIADVAAACGLDGAAILAEAGDPACKEELKRITDEAIERGAFGAPSIFDGDDLYFGNDRLGLLEERLRA